MPSGNKGKRCWCRAGGIIETRLALAQVAVALSLVGWDAQGLVLAIVSLAPSELDRAVLPSPGGAILARDTVAGIVSNAILTDSSILAGTLLTLIDVNSTFHTCKRDLEIGSHRGTGTPSQSLPGTALPSSLQGAVASKEPHIPSEGPADDARARKPNFCVLPGVIYRALACQPKSPHQLLSCPKLKPHRQSMCRRYSRTKTAQTKKLCFCLNRFGMLKSQVSLEI